MTEGSGLAWAGSLGSSGSSVRRGGLDVVDDGSAAGLDLVGLARVCADVGRPEDAVRFLAEAALRSYETDPEHDFDGSERALFSKSLKKVVNSQRKALRVLLAQQKRLAAQDSRGAALVGEYRALKVVQFENLCVQIVALIRDVLLPVSSGAESVVFYCKLAGDHLRYLCELPVPRPASNAAIEKRKRWVEEAEQFYQSAFEESQSDLSPTDPLRLSLILNFAIFYYDIQRDPEHACEFAKSAYDDAAAELGLGPSTNPFVIPTASNANANTATNVNNGNTANNTNNASNANTASNASAAKPANTAGNANIANAANTANVSNGVAANAGSALGNVAAGASTNVNAKNQDLISEPSTAIAQLDGPATETTRILKIIHESLQEWTQAQQQEQEQKEQKEQKEQQQKEQQRTANGNNNNNRAQQQAAHPHPPRSPSPKQPTSASTVE